MYIRLSACSVAQGDMVDSSNLASIMAKATPHSLSAHCEAGRCLYHIIITKAEEAAQLSVALKWGS